MSCIDCSRADRAWSDCLKGQAKKDQEIKRISERMSELEKALRGCLEAMFMQERRESEDFHLSPRAAMSIWERARDAAGAVLLGTEKKS